jgi:hypothetical protein
MQEIFSCLSVANVFVVDCRIIAIGTQKINVLESAP